MKQIICALPVLLLCTCMPLQKNTPYRDVHHKKPLYSMDDYERSYRRYLEEPDEKNTQGLLGTLEKIIQHQKGSCSTTPPGIYSDLAILMQNQEDYGAARIMMESEINLYPEAQTYLNRLLKIQER